ncbi:MAG: rod shape-determining protein MreD [Pseudomonadota bacterium]|nr:rod shape-determining protein MreD [Pseudomonadota bacterium]
MEPKARGVPWVLLSCALALTLEAVTVLPAWARAWAPSWVALCLLYWAMALPQRYGLSLAWCMGILLDILTQYPLGAHAIALSWVIFFDLTLYQQLRMFPLPQQAAIVLVLIGLAECTVQLASQVFGHGSFHVPALGTAVSSALVWPALFLVLRAYRRRLRIA